jgi:aldehyde:ferredoxin oxidoreductase
MKPSYGWTGSIARVDLTRRQISYLNTNDYAPRFLGGLGIGQKIYFDETGFDKEPFDPKAPLIMMTGPLTGTRAPSASRLVICGKGPKNYPDGFAHGSLGGFFPAGLKQSGLDGLIIVGKAESPLTLEIADGKVVFNDARDLWGLTDSETRKRIAARLGNRARMLTIGPGAEGKTRFGVVASDLFGSASSGFGSVMGSKKIKAIVALGGGKVRMANPETVTAIRKQVRTMTGEGYYNAFGTPTTLPGTKVLKKTHCHGCPVGCWRSQHRSATGVEGVRKCSSPLWYATWDQRLHGEFTPVSFDATNLIQDNTLCGGETYFLMRWLDSCFERGILTESQTELPLKKMGSAEFLHAFIQKIVSGDGFGALLQKGYIRAAMEVGKDAEEVTAELMHWPYGPRLFTTASLLYAIEPKPKITEAHELSALHAKWSVWRSSQGRDSHLSTETLRKIGKRFWGSEESVDATTYRGKALAAARIQNREFAKESLILCDFAFPIFDDAGARDYVGDPSIESRLFEAVTGVACSPDTLERYGERNFTLNRAIHLIEGRKGRTDDTLHESLFRNDKALKGDIYGAGLFGMVNPELELPGKGDTIVSQKGNAVDKTAFETSLDDYYAIRSWDKRTGLFKKDRIADLQLNELTTSPLSHKLFVEEN